MTTQHRVTLARIFTLSLFALAYPPAPAQCELGWINDFGGAATLVDGEPVWDSSHHTTIVDTLTAYDPDGDGPAPPTFFAGGEFTHMRGLPIYALAMRDGPAWASAGLIPPLTGEPTRIVDSLVHDPDGEGPLPPLLYIAGRNICAESARSPDNPEGFLGPIAVWDGATWAAAAVHQGPRDEFAGPLVLFDDGEGLRLYASSTARSLFRLEDGVWVDVIAYYPNSTRPIMTRLIPTRIDSAPVLVLLGYFSFQGEAGTLARHIVGWKGPLTDAPYDDEFVFFGAGFSAEGNPLLVNDARYFDEDGEGPMPPSLYVCGRFARAHNTLGDFTNGVEARDIARWDGSQWHGVGPDPSRKWFKWGMTAIAEYDDGTGPALIAGGSSCHPILRAARDEDAERHTCVWPVQGDYLYGVARWTGEEWQPIGQRFGHVELFPMDNAFSRNSGPIRDFAEFGASGDLPELFVCGQFEFADGWPAGHIARLARPFLRGDSDGDGTVGFSDVAQVIENWGRDYWTQSTGPGDANASAFVTFADITFILERFGASCP